MAKKIIAPQKQVLTPEALEKLDLDKIICMESGGNMGMSGAYAYVVDGDDLVRYETEEAEAGIDSELRKRTLNNEGFLENFQTAHCGFANRFLWKKGHNLKLVNNHFIIDDQYKIEVSVPAIYTGVEKMLKGIKF